MSESRERCRQELEKLRKNQTERVQLLLQQHEEKEQKLKLENEKKEQELKKENEVKEEALKAENERVLSLVLEENESQEALMLAKHDGEERAAKKAEELKTERNVSAPSQLPQIPECPVSNIPEYTIAKLLKGTVLRSIKWYFFYRLDFGCLINRVVMFV